MTTRRQVLKWAATASAAAAGALQVRASAAASRESIPPVELFVFDRRFADARAAAARAAAHGVETAAFDGDLTNLWYDQLDLRWRAAPMTLAGITTESGLFVLETLAVDRGMRVIERTQLSAQSPGGESLYSWTIAPRTKA
ncbi:MAG TPA: hypothetical protein VE907_14215 [Gammaproteobacteria bacterium]|nr:hypothetical protein [Gammaproteobacteria bacterium]